MTVVDHGWTSEIVADYKNGKGWGRLINLMVQVCEGFLIRSAYIFYLFSRGREIVWNNVTHLLLGLRLNK